MTDKLIESAENRVRYLKSIKKKLQERLSNAPNGSMGINFRKGRRPQYYQITFMKNKKTRTYIPRSQESLARALAQKQYDQALLQMIETDLPALERFLEGYRGLDLKAAYDSLPDIRRTMVTPEITPDDTFIAAWRAKYPAEANDFPNDSHFITDLGEHVRSKSELLIANLLHRLGIPYIYEPKLELIGRNGRPTIISPDFLIMNLRTRQMLIFEHFGRMDDPEYADAAVRKIQLYEACGYRLGERLICSFETSHTPIDMKSVEEKLRAAVM